MTKLIDSAPRGGGPIGREGLKAFCDQLNARRAQRGIHERYYLATSDGVLTLRDGVHGAAA